jgi:hypothetical protein
LSSHSRPLKLSMSYPQTLNLSSFIPSHHLYSWWNHRLSSVSSKKAMS